MSTWPCDTCFHSSRFYLIVTQLSALFSLETALAGCGFCVLGTSAPVYSSSFPLKPADLNVHIYCHCMVRHFLLLVLRPAPWLHLSFIPVLGFQKAVRQLFPFCPLCYNALDLVDFFHDPFKSSLFQTEVLNYSIIPCTEAAPWLGYPSTCKQFRALGFLKCY